LPAVGLTLASGTAPAGDMEEFVLTPYRRGTERA
jgi:hypothetical protein